MEESTANAAEETRQPMDCEVQLAALQYSLFISIRLVAAPF